MSTHKYFDKICCIILSLTLVLTILFMNVENFGVKKASSVPGYETRLFDTSKVHTVNIVMDNWNNFIESCTNEEYVECSVIIDNEAYKNVAIRAKGNTSLSNVQSYGNDRYSFKIEFDHYDVSNTYYGLDKLSLNNIIQDTTYMKDFLTYQMMGYFGVRAPLCSYVQILVNGKEWGLYLAVEGVEDSFLSRNYGNDYGKLYKPDSMNMGGGRGNGGKFDIDDWSVGQNSANEEKHSSANTKPNMQSGDSQPPGGKMQIAGRMDSKGGSDVALIYSDDNHDSYQNIFENAKTEISNTDKDRFIASLKKLNENSNIEDIVNVEEVIRYFVVHNFVCNFDSYTGSMIHNYYLYENDGQLSMIPWDYNLAFGGFVGGSDATSLVNYPIDTPVSGGTIKSRPMLSWIFESEEYTTLYHQYFAEFISQYFDSGYFSKMMEDVKTMISPYVESDPTKFCTYEEFEKGIDTLKEFCLLRAESVNAQLDGTIAATSEKQDKETLIDASNLTISAMGSMGVGQGGGMDKTENKGPMPNMQKPDTSGEQNGSVVQAPGSNSQRESNSSSTQKETQGQFPNDSSGMQPPQNDEDMSTFAENGNGQNFPQGGNKQQISHPNNNNEQMAGQPNTISTNHFILLSVCGGGLLVGLLFALLYKKRV